MVPKGTAPDAEAPMRKRLSSPIREKITVGKRTAVRTRLGFHCSPPRVA